MWAIRQLYFAKTGRPTTKGRDFVGGGDSAGHHARRRGRVGPKRRAESIRGIAWRPLLQFLFRLRRQDLAHGFSYLRGRRALGKAGARVVSGSGFVGRWLHRGERSCVVGRK